MSRNHTRKGQGHGAPNPKPTSGTRSGCLPTLLRFAVGVGAGVLIFSLHGSTVLANAARIWKAIAELTRPPEQTDVPIDVTIHIHPIPEQIVVTLWTTPTMIPVPVTTPTPVITPTPGPVATLFSTPRPTTPVLIPTPSIPEETPVIEMELTQTLPLPSPSPSPSPTPSHLDIIRGQGPNSDK